jgi:hypothetical protein
MYTQSSLRTSVAKDNNRRRGSDPMPDQADDRLAAQVAMYKLARLYPDTFRMLLLAARETLRPVGVEARLDGHSPAPIAIGWEP